MNQNTLRSSALYHFELNDELKKEQNSERGRFKVREINRCRAKERRSRITEFNLIFQHKQNSKWHNTNDKCVGITFEPD